LWAPWKERAVNRTHLYTWIVRSLAARVCDDMLPGPVNTSPFACYTDGASSQEKNLISGAFVFHGNMFLHAVNYMWFENKRFSRMHEDELLENRQRQHAERVQSSSPVKSGFWLRAADTGGWESDAEEDPSADDDVDLDTSTSVLPAIFLKGSLSTTNLALQPVRGKQPFSEAWATEVVRRLQATLDAGRSPVALLGGHPVLHDFSLFSPMFQFDDLEMTGHGLNKEYKHAKPITFSDFQIFETDYSELQKEAAAVHFFSQVRNSWCNLVVVGRDSAMMRSVPSVILKKLPEWDCLYMFPGFDVRQVHNSCRVFTALCQLTRDLTLCSKLTNEDVCAGSSVKKTLLVNLRTRTQ
jgi:hypothetical protein